MNIDRLIYLAEWLEAGAPHQEKVKGFNIAVGVQAFGGDTPSCGTICCIAGAATQFFNDEDGFLVAQAFEDLDYYGIGEAPWDSVYNEGMNLLGLTEDQATDLFTPLDGRPGTHWDDYNDPLLAARVIRNLIATGEVDWDV